MRFSLTSDFKNLIDTQKKITLHSKFSPEKEADRILKHFFENNQNLHSVLIFGLGLGYILNSFFKKEYQKVHICCVEPFEELKELTFEKNNNLLKKNQKNLLSYQLHYGREFKINFSRKYSILFLTSYLRYYPEEIQFFKNRILFQTKINQNTKKFFSKLWVRSYFKNLSNLHKNKFLLPKMQNYQKKLTFIGASPQLEKQIALLKNKHSSDFFLSSDTASRFLLKKKIKIDMILSIDSGNGTLYHIQENSEKIPYLTWLGANSYIFEVKNPKYIYFSTFPIDQLIKEIFFPNLPCLKNPSLNIAGLAKSFSETYQFSSFKLLGVDFKSFYGKTHCKGTGYEIFHLPKINRKRGLEFHSKMNLEYKIAKDILLSKKNWNISDAKIKNDFLSDTLFKMDLDLLKKSLNCLEIQNFLQEELGENLKLNKYLKILS